MKVIGALGSLVGTALLASMFFHGPAPQSGAAPHQSSPSNRSASAEKTPAKRKTQRRPPPEDGPWKASQQYFAGVQSQGECPSHALPAGVPDADRREYLWCIPAGDDTVQAMIAMVPDPVHTHVALVFDRTVEAIQLAASKMNYVIDQYWLPWDSEPGPQWVDFASSQMASLQEHEKQEQPGLLMFRWNGKADTSDEDGKAAQSETKKKSKQPKVRVLYVFLVSDTTTTGINGRQFSNAVDYVQEVICGKRGCAAGNIRIMGPTSSGSLASLRRFTGHRPESFTAYSGTVSSATAINNQNLKPPPGKSASSPEPAAASNSSPHSKSASHSKPKTQQKAASLRLTFKSYVIDSEFSINNFLQWLHDNHNIRCDQYPEVAIFFEAATTYGSADQAKSGDNSSVPENTPSAAPNQCPATKYLYPREISSLRNAYQRTANGSLPADTKGTDATKPYLSFNLSDSTNSSDEPPDFSKQQGPLSKEAVLMQFGAEIRRAHYKYVGIAGSNVLDVMFLADFLRKACPDTRLFIVNSDLLFERELDNAPYLGMLAVSTYPLLEANRNWANPEQRLSRLPFSDQFEEGQYNATLATIGEMTGNRVPIDPTRLPLWLTAVGTAGYWPVKLLSAGPKLDPLLAVELGQDDFSPAWKAVTTLLCLFALLHIAILLSASPVNSFRDFALTTTAPTRRLFFIHVSSATLALAVGMLATPAWRFGSNDNPWIGAIKVLSPVVMSGLLLVCGLLHLNYLWWIGTQPKRREQEEVEIRRAHRAVNIASPCIWMLAAVLLRCWWPLFTDDPDHYGFFFAYRTVHLATGVSPFTPLLPLLMAIYIWTIFSTLRLRFGDQVRPRLDTRAYFPGHDKECGIASAVNRFFLEGKYRSIFFLTFMVWLLFFDPKHPFQLFEHRSFGWIYEGLFCLVVALMLSTGFRLRQIWLKLKKLLVDLERSRIRFAFSRLKGFSWSPIWRPGGASDEWTIMERSFESIRNIGTSTHREKSKLKNADSAKNASDAKNANDAEIVNDTNHASGAQNVNALLTAAQEIQSKLNRIGDRLQAAAHQSSEPAIAELRSMIESLCVAMDSSSLTDAPKGKEIQAILRDILRALDQDASLASIQFAVNQLHSQLRAILGTLRLRTAPADIQARESQFHGVKAQLQKQEVIFPAIMTSVDQSSAAGAFYNLDTYFGEIQLALSSVLNDVLEVLDEHWNSRCPDLVEGEELEKDGKQVTVNCRPEEISEEKQHIRQLEEYAALRYVAFIRGVLGHMRYLLIFLGVSFSLVLISLNIYSFEPHQSLIWSFTAIFVAIGSIVVAVLMQVHKDHILSRVTGTTPNELGLAFYVRIISFGAAPLIALIATNFPSIGHYLLSFLQPGLEALK